MGRIAAIDYGLKRIGIAVSDERGKIAFPMTTVEGGKKGAENVAAALKGKNDEKVLLGLPLLLNGKEGDMAIAVRKFSTELEKVLSLPIILWDERLSSVGADRQLRELSLNRKERSEKIDAATAALLLQSYLDQE